MDRLKQLESELGLAGVLIEPNVGGGIPRDKVYNSIRLFAEQVAPHLH